MTEAMREALGEKPVALGGREEAVLPRGSEEPVILSEACAPAGATQASNRPQGGSWRAVKDPPEEEPVILSEAKDPPVRSEKPGDPSTPLRSAQDDSAIPDYRSHFASLVAQGEALREELPGFDLDAALHDPAFLRLTAPGLGVGVREAWCALHREAFEERAARRGAEEAKALLARTAAQGALRPREGGGLDAAALTSPDPRALSRGARERLRDEIRAAAARGEKLYP